MIKEIPLAEALEANADFEPCGFPKPFLRAALWGGLASGKTTTSILIALGLGKKVAVIDTNGGQVRFCRDLGEFGVLELPNGSPTALCAAIEKASGYDVLVIDTASSEWIGPGSILDTVETQPPRKDKVSPWSVATPLHHKFMETMMSFEGHIIATYQAKHQYEATDNKLSRVSVNPVWREGTEYSFNFVGFLSRQQDAVSLTIEKSLFHKIPFPVIVNPGKETGSTLRKLLHLF